MISTIMLLGTLTGILLAAGWFFAGFLGMSIALVIAFIINFLSYWYSDKIVLRIYKAKESKNNKLEAIINKLAHDAKIPKPKIYEIKSKQPNAFATGRNPKHAAIAVTDGLLELNDEEIEGVLGHELSHIKNRDVLVSTMAATIAGAISYIAQIGYWSMFAGDDRKEGNLLGLIFIIVFAPLAAFLLRMAISRSREYKADYTGALLTKNPKGLSSALRKISEFSKQNPMKGSTATSHLWIVNPFHKDWFTGLFSTHPPIELRIERLESIDIKD